MRHAITDLVTGLSSMILGVIVLRDFIKPKRDTTRLDWLLENTRVCQDWKWTGDNHPTYGADNELRDRAAIDRAIALDDFEKRRKAQLADIANGWWDPMAN